MTQAVPGMGQLFAGQEPPPFSRHALEALSIWSMMGNELRFEALPVIMAVRPVKDPELAVDLLLAIRDVVTAS